MPLVQLITLRSCAAIAALAIASAAAAVSGNAYADTFDVQPQQPQQALGVEPTSAQSEDARAVVNDEANTEPSATASVALDDHVLAKQRGTGLGLMTVAASAQTLRGGSSVTLWDEIAPPAPVPVPVDTSHVAQSNAVSYFRK
ncbi:MAG TPA: hypothetical protein VHC91_03435 [Trinickia sp.]|jgi:hypothetical protein|uniref:hypothetical protein n=1 Tax=Trinickia sp. TaxID=2571163 RepID=UPI002CAC92CE|nr:hypothetical protein [Trinickia sp.]HVW49443.1 hypothetical protein [Trinickia sp.]